jgi:hypothetical protein
LVPELLGQHIVVIILKGQVAVIVQCLAKQHMVAEAEVQTALLVATAMVVE